MSDTEVIPITKKQDELRGQAQELMKKEGISFEALAEAVGFSRSVVSTWFAGKYEHATGFEVALEGWVRRMTGDQLLDLKNVRIVREACQYAVKQEKMVLVVGAPGTGKTTGLKQAYRERVWDQRKGVFYHYTAPLIRPGGLVRELAKYLGAPESGSAHAVLLRVAKAMARRPSALVFDEAQQLNVMCLEAIRYLHDTVGIPVMLVGSMSLLRTLLESTDRHRELEQLQSRIALKVELQPLEEKEAFEVMRAFVPSSPRPLAKLALELSRGITRDLVNGMRNSKQIMTKSKLAELTEDVLRLAFKHQLV